MRIQNIAGESAPPTLVVEDRGQRCSHVLCARVSASPSIALNVGDEFATVEAAEEVLHAFARCHLFHAKRNRSERDNNGDLRKLDFVCSRARAFESQATGQRCRPSEKNGCQFVLRISSYNPNRVWRVIRFEDKHNHQQLTPAEYSRHRSNRTIPDADVARISSLKAAGLKVKEVMRIVESENGGKVVTPYSAKDVHNVLAAEKAILGGHDATHMLGYLRTKQVEDSEFFFCTSIDGDGRLENIFWIDADARRAAAVFGDVLLFDSTYQLNRYSMPFVPFVSVNNYGQTVLLGCALIRREDRPTFEWILKAWKQACGRTPLSVMTDQDKAMKAAIEAVFPDAVHAFCIWHIMRKFPAWFSSKLGSQYGAFVADFHALRRAETTAVFEAGWKDLEKKHRLEGDERMVNLYGIRHHIGLPWLRGSFFGGMTTTQRSESINSFFDGFVDASSCLVDFLRRFDDALEARLVREIECARDEKLYQLMLKTGHPIEKQAAEVLTRYAFNLFQEELLNAMKYSCQPADDEGMTIVRHFTKNDGGRSVVADDGSLHCSCKNFEFHGILCRHALRVLMQQNKFRLPDEYLPQRWRKDALQRSQLRRDRPTNSNDRRKMISMLARRLEDAGCVNESAFTLVVAGLERLLEEANRQASAPVEAATTAAEQVGSLPSQPSETAVLNPPRSSTKGRPRQARAKHPLETGSKRKSTGDHSEAKKRQCRTCGGTGHDRRNCAEKRVPGEKNENSEGQVDEVNLAVREIIANKGIES